MKYALKYLLYETCSSVKKYFKWVTPNKLFKKIIFTIQDSNIKKIII